MQLVLSFRLLAAADWGCYITELSPKKTQKTKPLKKIPETDAIFKNVVAQNQASDANPKSVRVSIDSKAKVKIGTLSRGGKSRTLEAKRADDHDSE